MNSHCEMWMTLHELAQLVSAKCSTRAKTTGLVKELRDYPKIVQDNLLRDANLVVVALEELLHLAEQSQESQRQTANE